MTYVLDGDAPATLSRRPVTVTAAGSDARDVVLRAEGASTARAGRPNVLVLTQTTGTTTVRVAPAPGTPAFPPGTAVSLTVRTDAEGDEVVVLPAADVSGATDSELIVVDVLDGTRLSVAAVNHVREPALSPLATAARAQARAGLRAARTPEPIALGVAVDLSMSMAPAIADGSVEAVVEVVAGLSHVVGWRDDVVVHLVGVAPRRLPAVPADRLGRAVAEAASAAGPVCGFRSALAPAPAEAPSATVVVTDAVPADVAALARLADGGHARHLVLVEHAVGPGPAVRADGVPTAFLPPPAPPHGAVAGLLGAPPLLQGLVTALMSGLTAQAVPR